MFDLASMLVMVSNLLSILMDFFGKLFGGTLLAIGLLVVCSGCASVDRTGAVMQTLQQGKAKGHLVLTTPGAVSVGMQNEWFIGARGSTLAFDGDIDFSDAAFVLPATSSE